MISLVPHGSGNSKSIRLGDGGGSKSTNLLNIRWPLQQQPRPPLPSSSRRRRFASSMPRRRTSVGMVFVSMAGCFVFPASPDAAAAAFVVPPVPTAAVVRGIVANNAPERGGGGTCSELLRETNTDGSREPESSNDDDETTRESLRETLSYIEALEERNKAQLGSFVDEADQWDSLEDFEKELLSSKADLEKQLDELLGKQEE